MSVYQRIYGGKKMTKIVYNTDLKEVKSIRFRCLKCGTVIERKIELADAFHSQCVQCNEPIPGPVRGAFFNLNEAIHKLRETENFAIELETEKEN